MTDPTCRDCGKPIQWLKTKNGKMAPFDLEPRSHFASCTKKRAAVDDPPAVMALMALGIKVMEARELVKGLRGDDETILTAALRRRDQEGTS